MSQLIAVLVAPLMMLPGPVGSIGPVRSVGLASVPAARAAPPARAPSASGARVPVGRGVWPLDPRPEVVRGFDPPASAYGAGHRGADLLGRAGQPVRSTLAGTVTFAGPLAGRGVVVVDHGFGRTTYQPVQASVGVGQHVGRGQVVGLLRPAGSHCTPRSCLHWGLLRGRTYLDPLVLVGGRPVRLLPLSSP